MRGLDRRSALGTLSAQASRDLMPLGTPGHFAPGRALFPRVLFPPPPALSHTVLICDGLAKLTWISDDGHPTILSVHGPGDLLGEDGAIRTLSGIESRPAAAGARMVAAALTAVTARVFTPAAMRWFLDGYPEALAATALGLCERLEEASARIASAGRDNADRRLARLLCDLERYGKPHQSPDGVLTGTMLPVRLSHADLASWIGTCPETVGRAIRRWRGRTIISASRRGIIVHDLETLARIAGIQVRRRSWNWPAMPARDELADQRRQRDAAAEQAARAAAERDVARG